MKKPLKEQNQRPEGALLERALMGPPRKGLRELAREIGLSDARVRQIINGYRTESGQTIQIVGPPETVARMAYALGVTPDQLENAGRSDAASSLRDVIEATGNQGVKRMEVALDVRALKAELREWIDTSMTQALYENPPPEGPLYLWRQNVLADVLADRVLAMQEHITELRGQLYERDVAIAEVLEIARGGDEHDERSAAASKVPEVGPADQPTKGVPLDRTDLRHLEELEDTEAERSAHEEPVDDSEAKDPPAM